MEKQYVRPKGNGLISVPLNTLTIEMLQEALDKAIKDEDYELASHLRDEIKRRI
jgi:protein-arginine kinase activator protein McsA